MSFNSIDYLVFFPIVVFLYFMLPKRIKMYWLLAVSYYFYMSWNAKYGFLILFSTVVTYVCGLGLEKAKRSFVKKQKIIKIMVLFSGLIINLGLLFYFKYINFIINNFNDICKKIGWGGGTIFEF